MSENYNSEFKIKYYQTKNEYNELHKAIIKLEAGTTNPDPAHLTALQAQAKELGECLYQMEVEAERKQIIMDNPFNVKICVIDDGYQPTRQYVLSKEEEILFEAWNLDFNPEDAILTRDLFNATDYVNVLKEGIELGRKGYTGVEYKTVFVKGER